MDEHGSLTRNRPPGLVTRDISATTVLTFGIWWRTQNAQTTSCEASGNGINPDVAGSRTTERANRCRKIVLKLADASRKLKVQRLFAYANCSTSAPDPGPRKSIAPCALAICEKPRIWFTYRIYAY